MVYAFFYQFRLFDLEMSVAVFIALFLLDDFCYYWFHRFSHESRFLWASHSIHHSSLKYNLSTALRQTWTGDLSGSFLFWVGMPLLGFKPEWVMLMKAFSLIYQFWIHTELIKKLPGWLEFFFNTPSHHRVHHARNPKYIDKNHAGTLIIWDRLFKTFEKEDEPPHYGITKPLKSWNPVWANFAHYSAILSDLKRVPSVKDKVRLLFKKPGWKPEYMGGFEKAPDIDPAYEKFENRTSVRLNFYVSFQFLVLMTSTMFFLYYVNELEISKKIISALFIIFSVASFGFLFENRKWSRLIEFIRLIAVPIAFISLFYSKWLTVASLIAIAYLIISLIWFIQIKGRLDLLAQK